AANEEWIATFYVDAGAAITTSTGIQFAVTVPSGATMNAYGLLLPINNALNSATGQRTTTSGAAIINLTSGSAIQNNSSVELRVWVLNGATPGSVTLQWAQGTSSGTALTFRKGSFLRAERVA